MPSSNVVGFFGSGAGSAGLATATVEDLKV